VSFRFTLTAHHATDTPHVRMMEFSTQDRLPEIAAGQWFSFQHESGFKRAYSILEPDRLVFCYDIVPEGKASNWLRDLEPGEQVEVTGPFGHFTLEPPLPPTVVMMTWYTGVVPAHCLLRRWLNDSDTEFLLLHGSPPSTEGQVVLFDDRFQAMSSERLSYRSFQRPEDIRKAFEAWHAERFGDGDALPCFPMVVGINDFVRPIRKRFKALGYGRGQFKIESYG